jgi:GNAT superfamily N-acetyltransferase/RimJ/RimL family protein N-acetyltransferase
VKIEQFDGQAEPDRVRECFRIVLACYAVDQPDQPNWSLGTFTAKWVDGFDANPQESWIATDPAGETVGCYLLTLPDKANLSRANVVLRVPPDRRRAGIGTALLRHCADRARMAGRDWLAGDAWDGTAGEPFAIAVGATGGIPSVHRTMRFDDSVRDRLPGLRAAADAHAAGYSLLNWTGPTPEDLLEQVAAVHGAMADAPRDAGVEPSVWDADRIARAEKLIADSDMGSYTVAARHDASGRLAALTDILTDPGAPGWGIQQLTAVLQPHRGHRLGLLVKVAMLELLTSAAPDVGRIVTDNAGSNEYMIAINKQLGFEVSGVTRSWQLDLTGSAGQS